MAHYRDIEAFEARAPNYETGYRGRMHRDIVERSAEIVLEVGGRPHRVLDVGCGTGVLLRILVDRLEQSTELIGVDAAPAMIEVARHRSGRCSICYSVATAEQLPFADDSFDLLVSTNSFDHWTNQAVGLSECSRVLRRGGQMVLTDQFSMLMVPTLLGSRRAKARTKRRASVLIESAGFRDVNWHRLYAFIIATAVASKGR